MGSIVKGLFGGSKTAPAQSQSTNQTGFIALPQDLQDYYRDILSKTSELAANPDQYFKSGGFSADELAARQMMSPENIQANLSQYLNPFQARIEEDINRQFEAPQSMLTQRASEAGAFGGSRMRQGQTDLERARLDALAGASANQYNTAYDQLQGGISNLLGFGGLQRQLETQDRQALPAGLEFASNIFSPLLGGGTQQMTDIGARTSTSAGLIPTIGGISSGISGLSKGIGALAGLFSDARLKENIKLVGKENGFNIYEFNYKGLPQKYTGVMAQEVKKVRPDAVGERLGYMTVNYGAIGVKMKEVA